jgi:hypothetical protein
MRSPHSFSGVRAILHLILTNKGKIKALLPLFIKDKKKLAFVLAVVTALGLVMTKLEELIVMYNGDQIVTLLPQITGQA